MQIVLYRDNNYTFENKDCLTISSGVGIERFYSICNRKLYLRPWDKIIW